MVLPVGYFLGAFVLKKVSALAIYNTASAYGWPRVYKRILEQSRIHVPPQDQVFVQRCVRGAIEKPTEMYVYMRDSKVIDFAKSYVDSINVKKAGHAVNEPPTFLYSFAQFFVQALTPYKFLSALGREAEKKARKTER